MDKMQEWEISEFYSTLQYSDTIQWEICRWLMYAIVQVNSKKKIDIKQILEFPWEKDMSHQDKTISKKDISKLKAMSEEISKNYDLR